jgi:putative transposase
VGVQRSTIYAGHRIPVVSEEDLLIRRLIDAEYTERPFYGSRRMVVILKRLGHVVNRKRVQRLMRTMGLAGMAPGPHTSQPHLEHKIYPYLLRGLPITRPNQVWSTDLTYIRLARGFAYLVAIIDWYSRKVLSWRISNTMDADFCVDSLEEAIRAHGKPEIFNSDQGSQFTSGAFTEVLNREGIKISMDGRGRAFDNIFVERLWRSVKHEHVYLYGHATMGDLLTGLSEYFEFYNAERPHQALGNRTPNEVYLMAEGGGAMIVDRFGGHETPLPTEGESGVVQEEKEMKTHDFPTAPLASSHRGAGGDAVEKSAPLDERKVKKSTGQRRPAVETRSEEKLKLTLELS